MLRKTNNVKVYSYISEVDSLTEVELDMFFFPGGEPHVNSPEWQVAGSDYIIQVNGGSFDDLGLAIVVKDALIRWQAYGVSLFIPYFPGARMDRNSPLTVSVYADIINGADFDRVIILDPHSIVTTKVLEMAEVMDLTSVVPEELFQYTATATNNDNAMFVVIAPDAGAVERAKSIADHYDVPLVVASKTRDPENNFAVSKYECEMPHGVDYAVVIDDICDGGGTFKALAEATGLPRHKLRLWTTHGIYSKGLSTLYADYGYIAATGSFPHSTSINHTVDLLPHLVSHLERNKYKHRLITS